MKHSISPMIIRKIPRYPDQTQREAELLAMEKRRVRFGLFLIACLALLFVGLVQVMTP